MKYSFAFFIMAIVSLAGCAATTDEKGAAYAAAQEQKIIELERARSSQERRIEELTGQVRRLAAEKEKLEQALGIEKAAASLKGKPREDLGFLAVGLNFSFLTTAMDWDGRGGDDGISVFIVPADYANDPIKSPGSFSFELYDEAMLDEPVMKWSFTEKEVAESWVLVSTAYHFRLLWRGEKAPPAKAIVVGSFSGVFGEKLTARKKVDIRIEE